MTLPELAPGLSPEAATHVRPTDYLLVKLASRCNLRCTYCYWFRDASVYDQAAVMTREVEDALLEKLARHLERYRLDSFFILFHGGEPLLIGRERFDRLTRRLRELELRAGIRLRLALTTNGLLIDDAWADLFARRRVSVTLSLDGPPELNDSRRIDARGRGSAAAVLDARARLVTHGADYGMLAVCEPSADPRAIVEYFVRLGENRFDVLMPDATHEDVVESIAPFYIGLFDAWLDEYAARGVRIRIFENIVRGLAGYPSNAECLGYGANLHFSLMPNGALEALDTLRMIGTGATKTSLNILRDEIQDLQNDPFWREALEASLHLNATCRSCAYQWACGGGHLGWRWSRDRRFDNVSVYCADLKAIFRHVWTRISGDLVLTHAA